MNKWGVAVGDVIKKKSCGARFRVLSTYGFTIEVMTSRNGNFTIGHQYKDLFDTLGDPGHDWVQPTPGIPPSAYIYWCDNGPGAVEEKKCSGCEIVAPGAYLFDANGYEYRIVSYQDGEVTYERRHPTQLGSIENTAMISSLALSCFTAYMPASDPNLRPYVPKPKVEPDLLALFNKKALDAEKTCNRCKGPLSYVGFLKTECVCDPFFDPKNEQEDSYFSNQTQSTVYTVSYVTGEIEGHGPTPEQAREMYRKERNVFIQQILRRPGNTRT